MHACRCVCGAKEGNGWGLKHILIRAMKGFERLRRGMEAKKRTIKVNRRGKMRGGR